MLKLLLIAIAMILGLSAVIVGAMVGFVGDDPQLGVLVAVPGLVLGVGALRWLVRFNRSYQDDHLAAVLADPSQIIARWRGDRGEVILAPRGLFIGRSYYPFAGEYQTLRELSLDRTTGRLFAGFSSIAPEPHNRPTVTVFVAEEARDAVETFADHLHATTPVTGG